MRARLEMQGLGLDVFYEEDGAVERILRSRGIRGVIMAPLIRLPYRHLNWDWNKFSVVIAGSGLWRPEFNRVRFNHFEEMSLILHHLRHLKFKKVGLITDERVDNRSQRAITGGFYAYADNLAGRNKAVFVANPGDGPAVIRWLIRYQPDAVIAGSAQAVRGVQGSGIETQLVFISKDFHPDARQYPGIHQDYGLLGNTSAEQLFSLLALNQSGIPNDPMKLFVTGRWEPGGVKKVVL